jgi:dolichol-phosphate mannosyltransferase
VLPCYNEEENIEHLVLRIEEVLSKCFPYRIIAVDDGSTDETGKILKSLSRKFPVTVITHRTNLGLSAALKNGLNAALQQASDGDFIVTMDADSTHDPRYIVKMAHCLRGADIVIASRYVTGGHQINVPLYRTILSKATNLFFKFVTGVPAHDVTSGYRAFKASVLKKTVQRLGDRFVTSKGFEVAVEILSKTYWHGGNGIKIRELPFFLDYSAKKGKSKMKLFPTARLYVNMLQKIRSWRRGYE